MRLIRIESWQGESEFDVLHSRVKNGTVRSRGTGEKVGAILLQGNDSPPGLSLWTHGDLSSQVQRTGHRLWPSRGVLVTQNQQLLVHVFKRIRVGKSVRCVVRTVQDGAERRDLCCNLIKRDVALAHGAPIQTALQMSANPRFHCVQVCANAGVEGVCIHHPDTRPTGRQTEEAGRVELFEKSSSLATSQPQHSLQLRVEDRSALLAEAK